MTILTAVDGEHAPDRVVDVGYELARDLDEEMVVLHVMSQDQFDQRQQYHGSTREASDESSTIGTMMAPGVGYDTSDRGGDGSGEGYVIESAQRDAAAVANDVTDRTLGDEYEDVSFQGRVGEPVEEVLEEADRQDARYVVIGGRKTSPVGKAIFGSHTQSLLLNADRPVLTVMRDEE